MSKVCHVNGPQIYIRKQIEMMEKLKGHIAYGLSVLASIRPSVHPLQNLLRYSIEISYMDSLSKNNRHVFFKSGVMPF